MPPMPEPDGSQPINVRFLSGSDLGRPVRLIDPKSKQLVLGDLEAIEHKQPFGDGPAQALLTVKASGWRWFGALNHGDLITLVAPPQAAEDPA